MLLCTIVCCVRAQDVLPSTQYIHIYIYCALTRCYHTKYHVTVTLTLTLTVAITVTATATATSRPFQVSISLQLVHRCIATDPHGRAPREVYLKELRVLLGPEHTNIVAYNPGSASVAPLQVTSAEEATVSAPAVVGGAGVGALLVSPLSQMELTDLAKVLPQDPDAWLEWGKQRHLHGSSDNKAKNSRMQQQGKSRQEKSSPRRKKDRRLVQMLQRI